MKDPINKIKYILYARKSSESEDRQVQSIESQIDELKRLAKREGLQIVGEPLSESKSAKKPGREIFNQMIERINQGEAQGILCWKIDRLARNPIDGAIIQWNLQQGVIKHIRAFDKSYYPTDNVLMMSVEFGMANQFIRDLSQNTRRGLKSKAERGMYPCKAPVGYMNDKYAERGNKALLVDPERFDKVRKLFDLMLTGNYTVLRLQQIAHDELNLDTLKGGLIGRTTIYSLFTNPIYYGSFEYPVNSGTWYKGNHRPIITIEEYDRVQEILGRKGKPRPQTHILAFTGTMKCRECGCTITAEEKTKHQKNGNSHHYIYYHCTKRKNPDCAQKCLEEKEFRKQVKGKLAETDIPPQFHIWAMKWFKHENTNDIDMLFNVSAQQKAELELCSKKLSRLTDMRIAEEIDEEEFKIKKVELKREEHRLEQLISNPEDKYQKLLKEAERIFNFAETATTSFEVGSPELCKRIFCDLGSNRYLNDKKVEITIEKPLIMLKPAAKELREIHDRLEPTKNRITQEELEGIYSSSPLLQGQ